MSAVSQLSFVLLLAHLVFASALVFAKDQVRVLGPWDFYWKQWIEFKDLSSGELKFQEFELWTHHRDGSDLPVIGWGSYHTRIQSLKPNFSGYTVGIRSLHPAMEILIYQNGTLLSRSEQRVEPAKLDYPSIAPVQASFNPVDDGPVDIIIRVSNTNLAKFKAPGGIQLSTTSEWISELEYQNFWQAANLGIALAVLVYSAMMYIRYGKDKLPLALSMLSFVVICRCLVAYPFVWDLWGETGSLVLRKLDYATIPLFGLAVIEFVRFIISSQDFPRLLVFYRALSASVAVLVLFVSLKTLHEIFFLYASHMLVSVGLFVSFVFTGWKHKAKELKFCIVGVGLLAMGGLWDVVFYASLQQTSIHLSPFALAIFLLLQSQLVAFRSAQAFKAVEAYSAELEEKEKARSLFFHNTSHELRTPLNGIMGFLDLVRQGRYGEVSMGAIQQINKALRLVESLRYQVNIILDLAKAKKGELKVHYQDLSLSEVRAEADSLAEGLRLRGKGLEYSSELSIGSERFVTDHHKLLTIIRNLLGNAFKFKDPSRQNFVNLRIAIVDAWLEIKVSDTGIGIPDDQIDGIFDEFSQVDSNARRRYEGTGLGLAMVRNLVDLMGGRLEVDSHEGEGSVLTVRLPPHGAELTDSRDEEFASLEDLPSIYRQEVSEVRPVLPAFEANWKVMIVDDNETNCEVMREILRVDGYTISYTLSGRSAISLMEDDMPDVLLLDLMMPEVSGEDVIKFMRDHERLKYVPIILITARASEEDRIYGLRLGADDYLPKPIVADELRLRVYRLVERQSLLRELASKAGCPDKDAI